VIDGATGAIYTATATDADGDQLTFSISGGADAAQFSITASGALSFVKPPSFNTPTDADHNNVYLVTLQVSDGKANASLNLAVTVTAKGGALRAHRVGTGFVQPLFVAGLTDGSGRLYVVEKGGLIEILNPADGSTAPFLDVRSQVSTTTERGLVGFALAPDFATSGRFYVYLTNTAGNIELRRYNVMTTNHDVVDMTTAKVLLTITHDFADFHNGGWMGFDTSGLLYIAVGDGGLSASNPATGAQDKTGLLGKLLRIDVSGSGYTIPPGNPFANSANGPNDPRPEIWALGLRNPFRDSYDPVTGDLFIADVGENTVEEIDRMRPGDGGANFGWPYFEGTLPYAPVGAPPAGFSSTQPVAQYMHGSDPTHGDTIIGGYVYRGPIAQLQGLYFFADWTDGNIWTVSASALVPGTTLDASQFTLRNGDLPPDAGAITSPDSFGIDAAGALYIVSLNGDIFRIEQAN
jgi:glucose/arabinose dehydrogenase